MNEVDPTPLDMAHRQLLGGYDAMPNRDHGDQIARALIDIATAYDTVATVWETAVEESAQSAEMDERIAAAESAFYAVMDKLRTAYKPTEATP